MKTAANASTVIEERVHPVSLALKHAMDTIHADYEAVMGQRTDSKGNFDPLKLPNDRECIKASTLGEEAP